LAASAEIRFLQIIAASRQNDYFCIYPRGFPSLAQRKTICPPRVENTKEAVKSASLIFAEESPY